MIKLAPLSIALGATSLMVAACSEGGPDNKTGPLTAKEVLDTCSSFTDAESTHNLEFTLPDNVKLTQLTSAAETAKEDVQASNNVVVSKGTFTVDNASSTVTVNFAGEQTTYTTYSPAGMTGCMLVTGFPNAADLTKSWFADADPPDPDDDRVQGP